MSLRTKLLSAITTSFAVAAFATFAVAQETPAPEKVEKQKVERGEHKAFGKRGEHGKGMRGGRPMRMHGLLGVELTADQKEQMRKIHEANRPDAATFQELNAIRKAKRDGTITAEQQERAKALRSQAREKGESIRRQIEGILTAEQRQQIETRKLEMRQKMQERRQLRQPKTTTPPVRTTDN